MAHWGTPYRYSNKIEEVDQGRRAQKNIIPFEEFRIYLAKTQMCVHYYPIWNRTIIDVQPDVGKGAKEYIIASKQTLIVDYL